jgi:Domain of unknown function (DUF4386)
MFFGLWLLPLGYLVIKSGYVPKPLGARAMNGSLVFKEQHQAHIHYSRDS